MNGRPETPSIIRANMVPRGLKDRKLVPNNAAKRQPFGKLYVFLTVVEIVEIVLWKLWKIVAEIPARIGPRVR